MRIFSLLTGGIDLPKLSTEVASLRLASEDTNAALADHIVKANARMATIERVQSDNTAQCQIRMNGLQDLIASRAHAEDVETLRMKVDRRDGEFHSRTMVLSSDIAALRATVAGLSAKVEALTAAKLSEVKARKAPKKSG
ncbi:hypothetical protein [Brevundimonas sp.]|uniref:hypothetical protein n=1 Tax=Brevundimonas sp. TaxID=1871086 RepID=UPI0028ABF0FF|nr:hypothetical protein [Brevundimonas sp.]